MTLDVCCLLFTLLSANVSDLQQTARFTHQVGHEEINLAAAWLVDGPNAGGEVVSGVVAALAALHLERQHTTTARSTMVAWALIHARMVWRNERYGTRTPYLIMLPVFTLTW